MKAWVYRSARQADTYVFLRERDDFACLPEVLAQRLGLLEQVLEIELTPERRLARSDVATVLGDLTEQGFHLQLPPRPPRSPLA
ncbi:MAG TPA: YcgL domain-containing protein [Candidatus Saccharimonadia bacterium]|nr:YcgL domain-containing protein [Candidatus Saccharimonadia bacterium]